jgi:putative DNA primase/helicase
LTEEFGVFLAARAIPEELLPWPEPVDTAELLAAIEMKFRRYVVASDAIVTASVLWPCFTYIAEIATHAPKLVYTFPERDAGKSTVLHTLRWMSQRAYMAVDVTAAVTFRILDRLRPALFLDEADSAFLRGTVLATIFNTSWLNGGSKIPRTGRHGEIEEFECYGPQAFAMRKLCMPDTTLSRCIVCMIWPKLPSEVVEDFGFCDDDEFKVIRRKAMRWAIDNATTLRSAVPVLPPGFTNRIRVNWKMLLAIAELAGGAWPKRAREAALTLEIDRDEPSADIRLFQGLQDIWGDVTEQNRSSQNICMALRAHPSGEWNDINPIGLAARLRPFNIHPVHNLRPTKPSEQDRARGGGYRRSQFEKDAWPRLLGKLSSDSLTRSPGRGRSLTRSPGRGRKRK